jgi:hypothetical protein
MAFAKIPHPSKEINSRADWRKYDVNRNRLMADNILRDLGEHEADACHAPFIVGSMHAMVNLSPPGGDPMKSAGGTRRCSRFG